MDNIQPPRFKRYYGDDGKETAGVPQAEFMALLHAAYTHWVRRGYNLHDFSAAVDHVATSAFGQFAFDGQPNLVGAMPERPVIAFAKPVKHHQLEQRRFYDEVNAISPEVDLSHLEQAIHFSFIRWLAEGFHPRDFSQFAHNAAAILIYDHSLCKMFNGGLGGGKTEEQFLTECYHG